MENGKQATDQTALTIMKALTEATNCAFRAKKVEEHDKEKNSGASRPLPHFLFFSAPLIMHVFYEVNGGNLRQFFSHFIRIERLPKRRSR